MISQLITIVFVLVAGASFYRLSLGFTLAVACRLLIPPIVRVNLIITELSLNSCLILLLLGLTILKIRAGKVAIPTWSDSRVFFKPFLVLLGILVVSCLFGSHGTLQYRLSSLLQFLYTEFLLCFVGWFILSRYADIRDFIKIISMAAVIAALYGTYCYISSSNPYISLVNSIYQPVLDALSFMEYERGGIVGRIQGTMTHPLIWGGSCMVLFVLFFSQGEYMNRYIRFAVLALLTINILFSGSRSALLSMMAALAVIFYVGNIEIKKTYLVYAVFGAVALLVALYQVPPLAKYKDLFESTVFFWDEQQSENIRGSSISMRLEQLEGAFDMIDDGNLVTGLGQGFIKYYSTTLGVHPVLRGFESIVFMALVESGILGLLAWGIFFVLLWKILDKIDISKEAKEKFSFVGAKAFLLAYSVFVVSTGIQSTLYLFLVVYLVMLKANILSKYNYVSNTSERERGYHTPLMRIKSYN